MNSKNSKTSEPHRLVLSLLNKMILKSSHQIYCLIESAASTIVKSYKNNRSKILATTWNNKVELPDGSYSASDIHDDFEYIIKKCETLADNPPMRI